MKRLRILFGLLVTLALVLSLTTAVPAYAADVYVAKGVTPPDPNVYNLTDTIHYTILIINASGNESVVVQVVSDTLPDGTVGNVVGPALPYTIPAGQNVTYTCDWVATKTGTVVNNCVVSGYQITNLGNDLFDRYGQKSSLVIGQEVGGTASLVDKVRLVAPWAGLLACAAIVALVVLRRRRHA